MSMGEVYHQQTFRNKTYKISQQRRHSTVMNNGLNLYLTLAFDIGCLFSKEPCVNLRRVSLNFFF